VLLVNVAANATVAAQTSAFNRFALVAAKAVAQNAIESFVENQLEIGVSSLVEIAAITTGLVVRERRRGCGSCSSQLPAHCFRFRWRRGRKVLGVRRLHVLVDQLDSAAEFQVTKRTLPNLFLLRSFCVTTFTIIQFGPSFLLFLCNNDIRINAAAFFTQPFPLLLLFAARRITGNVSSLVA